MLELSFAALEKNKSAPKENNRARKHAAVATEEIERSNKVSAESQKGLG